jgi:hypothetical protein
MTSENPDEASASSPLGDPPDPTAGLLGEAEAESLATRIQAHAAHVAEAECRFLLLIGEFDAREGSRWYVGVASTAHWLSWTCSMSPGAAREHVRVARALREMPRTVAEFSAGRLSYSKVREMTRVAGVVDEEALVELARSMTASQLSRALRSFRALEGIRMPQESRREASWRMRDDGMVEIRAVLPGEVGAEVVAALDHALHSEEVAEDAARSRDGAPQDSPAGAAAEQPLPEQRRADVFVDLARAYLDTAGADRSGEDRHLVLVHATPDMLVDGSSPPEPAADLTPQGAGDVPAETPPTGPAGSAERADHLAPGDRCGVPGLGPLEARTVQRLACTGMLALLVTDDDGEVLHLGRARRLASRAQRRALRATQQTCQFPGCDQHRHLDAHHVVPWSRGGPTDLENLALLCRRHHVLVHEGGLRLQRLRSGGEDSPAARARAAVPGGASQKDSSGVSARYEVVDADGRPVQAVWPALLEHAWTVPLQPEHPLVIEDADGPRFLWGEGDTRIAPTTGGFAFSLHGAVEALSEAPAQSGQSDDLGAPSGPTDAEDPEGPADDEAAA